MALSEERKRAIREMSNAEIVDRLDTSGWTDADWRRFEREHDARTLAFCRDCSDPRELFYFAATYNWDHGVEHLRAIVRNPACDAATALLVFWRGAPEFNRQYVDPPSAPAHVRDTFELVQEIQDKYVVDGFAPAESAYDPSDDDGLSRIGVYNDLAHLFVRELPAKMYQAVSPAGP